MSTPIQTHLNAGYPILYLETHHDDAVDLALAASGRRWLSYAADQILVDHTTGEEQTVGNYQEVFAIVAAMQDAVLVVRDLQSLIANSGIYRPMLKSCRALKQNGSTIICVAPRWDLPAELSHSGAIVQVPLPLREELRAPLERIIEDAPEDIPAVDGESEIEQLLDAVAGLTPDEAENAFALSLAEVGRFDADIVTREKMGLLSSTGFLQVEKSVSMSVVGGMDLLKRYIADEVVPVLRDPLLAVRGIILAGLPGLGKSLAAKAFASEFGWPIIRFDLQACKGGLVGESEANVRRATELIEAVAPCVVWLDELEKAVGGATGASAATDGGTSLGMLGHLLTWLQEHNKPIFIVGTCNDYDSLPSALTRSGRFDERFFVDLPNAIERKEIAAVHLGRFGCDVGLAEAIAGRTSKYTGAEIEQLIKSAARLTQRSIDDAAIERASQSIRPVALVDAQRVDAIRSRYASLLRRANSPEASPSSTSTPAPRRALKVNSNVTTPV